MDMTIFFDRLMLVLKTQDRKQAFFDLCDLYHQVDAEQRDFLRSQWPFEREWFIPRDRTLLLTDFFSSEQRLRAALIYESLEKGETDWRDNLVSLCAIYHSAVRLGLDPERLFEEVAELSGETMAGLLRAFYHRSPEDRSLEAFGYREEATPEGIYLAGWGPDHGRPRYGHVSFR